MRWYTLPLITLALALSLPASAQQAPGGGGGGMRGMVQQLQQNMQNNGVNLQDLIQNARQQRQDGTFNLQDFAQQLQDSGVITPDMVNNLQNLRQNYQQNYQNPGAMGGVTNLQALMGSTDEEWTILAPRIQKVVDYSNELAQGTVGNPGWLNIQITPAQAAAQAPQSPVAVALNDLNNLLRDESSSSDDIRGKLTALRQAKQKVQTELGSARADLVSLLTLPQEGVLMSLAIVE